MRKGGLGSGIRLTVPVIYVEPKIMMKDGEVDKEVAQVVHDIWKHFNVNIRYLTVLPDHMTEEENAEMEIQLNYETTTESKLLSHIQPEIVVCFFGRKEVLPSNHKVYSRDELVNNYQLILSNLDTRDRVVDKATRYRRRRG